MNEQKSWSYAEIYALHAPEVECLAKVQRVHAV